MIDYMSMVREFMIAAQQAMPSVPTIADEYTNYLRRDLMHEELNELWFAMWGQDIVGIADGLADLLYVVYGTAIAYGIPIEEVFAEVHRSNMTKRSLDGTFHKDANGKVTKSPNYEPPRIATILLDRTIKGNTNE